jgi:hypothetical protein
MAHILEYIENSYNSVIKSDSVFVVVVVFSDSVLKWASELTSPQRRQIVASKQMKRYSTLSHEESAYLKQAKYHFMPFGIAIIKITKYI